MSRPTCRWHNGARGPSRLSERTQSVLDGSAFVVGDRLGDVRIDERREHGFFCDDTRMLSRWVLCVGEEPLELLGFDQSDHFACRFFLTPTSGPLSTHRGRSSVGGSSTAYGWRRSR